MKATYIVHGFVQGVGYRAYIKGLADRLRLGGIVMNQEDGSVLIIVEGEETILKKFEKGMDVSMKYGTQVHNIEKQYEPDANNEAGIDFSTFQIIK